MKIQRFWLFQLVIGSGLPINCTWLDLIFVAPYPPFSILPEVVTAKAARTSPWKNDDAWTTIKPSPFLGEPAYFSGAFCWVNLPRGYPSAPDPLDTTKPVLPSGMSGVEVRRTLRYGDLQVKPRGKPKGCFGGFSGWRNPWFVEVVFWGNQTTSQINAKSLRIF